MGQISGPFLQTRFFNASVISFNGGEAGGEQSGTVNISLVEDRRNGDVFTPKSVGEPCLFQLDGFKFEGLLKRYEQKGSMGGNPLYEVMLESPTELLGGVQVILGSFKEPTGNLPNLLNAFGYWENRLGFGGALTNESGMVWAAPFELLGLSSGGGISITPVATVGVKSAIEALTAGSQGDYGGPINYRGHTYKVDLSTLPVPPVYYRLGGLSLSILEVVSQLCQDSGHDYICYLEGHTIKFKTISRLNQPQIGQVAQFINARTDVVSKSIGIELRNDITNAVLIGGDIKQIVQVYNYNADETIYPFWGFDINDTPIVGTGAPEEFHEFYLNCAEIADIMGDTQYHCTIAELRLALEGFDGWAAWVIAREPDKAETINLVSAIDATSDLASIFDNVIFQHDLIAADPQTTLFMGEMNESTYWPQRAQRVYDFVNRHASEYFGRKFLVKIPFFIYWKQAPETTRLVASDMPTDGGFQAEGTFPLGLDFNNEDIFLLDDGRFGCFCRFPLVENIDYSKMNPENYVIQQGGVNDGIYVKATIDNDIGIIYPPGLTYPYCVINLSDPVQDLAPDALGGITDIAKIFGFETAEPIMNAFVERNGDFPVKISPPYHRPYAVALPIQSNRNSYGPWGTFPPWGAKGVPGKVYFEKDESLTPWEYGDIEAMNLAAAAKLVNVTTNMQESETGSVEMVGSPEFSLGDQFVADGPNITGITVNFGTNGVTTNYELRTYVRQFGAFARENADRIRRMGLSSQQIRRSVRALFHKQQAIEVLHTRTRMGFMRNTSRAVQQSSPHSMICGRMTFTEQFGYRTQCAFSTYPELVANSRGDYQPIWQATGAMSLEGLLRPFSTNYASPGSQPGTGDMPHYGNITAAGVSANLNVIPCRSTLNPFGADNDIDIMAWNQTHPGEMHTIKAAYNAAHGVPGVVAPDYENARLLGLRGPLVVVGWGYEYTGKPFPNATSGANGPTPPPIHQWGDTFLTKRRQHPENWRAGPVDLHYDMWRHCWTVPTILYGTLDEAITSTGLMSIKAFGQTLPDKVRVTNGLGGTLPIGKNAVVAYYPLENAWYVISLQC